MALLAQAGSGQAEKPLIQVPHPTPGPFRPVPTGTETGDDDATLARHAQAGSAPAFGTLVGRHHGRVYAFLLHTTRHRQDAEDLTQETFVRAWHKLDRFDPSLPLLPWLLTIARRLSIAALRRQRPASAAVDDLPETAAPPPAYPIWEIARRELRADAFRALWLHYHEDLPLREVATVLGKREGAVKVMLHRARKSLAKHLRAENPEQAVSSLHPHPAPHDV